MSQTEDLGYGSQNLGYVEMLYRRFLDDPQSVDRQWQTYFNGMGHDGWRGSNGRNRAIPATAAFSPFTAREDSPPRPAEQPVEPARKGLPQGGLPQGGLPQERLPQVGLPQERLPQVGLPQQTRLLLRRVAMFKDLSERELHALATITEELEVAGDFPLCRKGQTENDLFLIKEGSAVIIKNEEVIAELGTGEMVGELAVFDPRPRSSDIVTKGRSILLRISRKDLHDLLKSDNSLALAMLGGLSSRLRSIGFRQEKVDLLVQAFRELGHLEAQLDPLGRGTGEHPELDPVHYGFQEKDLDSRFSVNLGREISNRSLRDILAQLRAIYCRSIGAQFMHIDDLRIQEWIRVRMEEPAGALILNKEEQVRILKKLTDAELFETFLHRKFVGAKRFSLEGSESLIPLLDYAIEEAGLQEVDEVVIGMAHRGRLNVLVNIMDKPSSQVFREFRDIDPELYLRRGDVKYHMGYGCNRITSCGRKVHLSLCFNPSHLEFVGPVVLGRVRAKQERFGDTERSRALPLIIHGDAAFIGQGVTQELLNLSELQGYRTGGAVHVILNNQIGFTTNPDEGRSTQYSTDAARMLQIPIFHVNGEHPQAVAFVINLAMKFRKEFKKDVVIDMFGYRKYGHNESDDPAFTQPVLYQAIKKRKTVREAFVANLLKLGELSSAEAEEIADQSKKTLEAAFEASQKKDYQYQRVSAGKGVWAPYRGGADQDVPEVETRVPIPRLKQLIEKLSEFPKGFTPHPKIKRFLETQRDMAAGKEPLNWGAGEALAFASLLTEGASVRLAGQDSQRGTFSHRHSVWHDYKDGTRYIPLANLEKDQASFQVLNSPLSEIGVLGFEYGYSLDTPDGLVIWEAQFGDFSNVAQVIIDQFITSSEDKWRRLSGLCLFLPHGFEGQGPEHSSARLERFLMLSAMDNIAVVNLTTPAQLFHCLRRQVLRPLRKPLIVMSPKSLLRHPQAVSSLEDLAEGRFCKIIPDSEMNPKKVSRILICSGKLYFELVQKREESGIDHIAIIRLEQYYPLPREELAEAIGAYAEGTPVFWVQEEPLNMGAWSFLKLRFGDHIDGNGTHPFSRICRPEASSPATGSTASHKMEQESLILEALALK